MVRPRQQQQMSQIKNCPNLSVKKWRYTNLLLCNWITGTLSEEALEHVVGQNTTLEVWCCLEETYLQAIKEREV